MKLKEKQKMTKNLSAIASYLVFFTLVIHAGVLYTNGYADTITSTLSGILLAITLVVLIAALVCSLKTTNHTHKIEK